MTESMLQNLMKLFAIIASISRETVSVLSRSFVDSFLSEQFSPYLVKKYLQLFDENFEQLDQVGQGIESKRTSSLSVKIMGICLQINEELYVKNKYQILLSLIQFVKYFDRNLSSEEGFKQSISDAVQTIAQGMMINQDDYDNCWTFIADKFYKIPDKKQLLIVSDDSEFSFTKINHLQKTGLNTQVFILKIQQVNLFLFYFDGEDKLEIKGNYIFPKHVYILPKGSAIRGTHISPIYYSDIVSAYLKNIQTDKVILQAENIEFKFKNSENGIHKFNFQAESGQLVGIMGGSGTGKSTLLKVLIGSLALKTGNVLINGYNLQTQNEDLEGILGYVPQDDLLIAELTVYQNLYYNAKLCFGNLSREQITENVEKVLNNLDLFHIKDLLVGSPLNKFISGGQRKRLNIALELIREPYILFIDEPTSGLSSTDSENVLQLLKDQTLLGKLVIVNIHQPSSDLFKLFDKLLVMDKGGYPVYYGNPMESILYFKKKSKRVDAGEIECSACGNVQTDDILKLLERKKVNELGEFVEERTTPPKAWYELFQNELEVKSTEVSKKTALPGKVFVRPNIIKQFFTFSERNFLSKIADRQYLILAFGISPLLAVILGYFTKYFSGTESNPIAYVFSKNENIPAYLFMCVIVALFIGMIISAEEIITDRKILERESFLNLSRIAYLNSKIVFLFFLTALQMLTFVLVGNSILEVKGLNFNFWLVLFSTAMFAIMLGLNISASLKSVIAIYITIPFILVPFILLAGIIVKYDKLHYKMASSEFVPVVGDLMPSKWAYEALVVNQFSNNKYQVHFNEIDTKIENRSYELDYLIPKIISKIRDAEYAINSNKNKEALHILSSISSAILEIQGVQNAPVDFEGNLPEKVYFTRLKSYLEKLKVFISKEISTLKYHKDEIYDDLVSRGMSMKQIASMKKTYYNDAVADLVLNTNELRKVYEYEGKLIQKAVPIYKQPESRMGRAHFYSGIKQVGNVKIGTLWFNTIVLWIMSLILYGFLASDLGRKTSEWIILYKQSKKYKGTKV